MILGNVRSQDSNSGLGRQIPGPQTPLSPALTVCLWAGSILLWASLSSSYLERLPTFLSPFQL